MNHVPSTNFLAKQSPRRGYINPPHHHQTSTPSNIISQYPTSSNPLGFSSATMQFTTALMAALMAGTSLATINFGKARYDSGNVDNAIWIDGENACTYVYQGHDNPCDFNGGKFQAQNGFKYTVKDCGNSAFHLENADGSFNSFAHFNPYSNAGSGCANSQGRYHVDQEWSFY
ncbi:hypothetical protein PMIN03_012037 [Paraphaeosphaeria minitans]